MNSNSKNRIASWVMLFVVFLMAIIFWMIKSYQGSEVNYDNNSVEDTWLTASSSRATFRYPEKLETNYISTTDWPPEVQILNGPFVCIEAGQELERSGRTEQITVEERVYCATKISEGAVGSTYTQYAYAFPKDTFVVVLTFSLRFINCENYDEALQSECRIERQDFNPDILIDQIAQTLIVNVVPSEEQLEEFFKG